MRLAHESKGGCPPEQLVNNTARIENQWLVPNSSQATEEADIDQVQVCDSDFKDHHPAIMSFQSFKPIPHARPWSASA